MIEIRESRIDSPDAIVLINELNETLKKITGDDGTIHFNSKDVEQARSSFLVGYLSGMPVCCGAIREIDGTHCEVKRIYARKNSEHMGSRLIKALEEKAAGFGYDTMLLETRVQNEHAISFYKNNGYSKCKNFGVYVENENSYCMEKVIG